MVYEMTTEPDFKSVTEIEPTNGGSSDVRKTSRKADAKFASKSTRSAVTVAKSSSFA
jgi:hypothetical protein